MIIKEHFEPEIAELLVKLLAPRDIALLETSLNDKDVAEVFGADAYKRRQELVEALESLEDSLAPAALKIQVGRQILNDFKYFKKLLKKGEDANLTQTEEFACALMAMEASRHPVSQLCLNAVLETHKESEQ